MAQLACSAADLPGLCWLDGDTAQVERSFSYLGVAPVERMEASLAARDPLAALARLEADALDPVGLDREGPPPSEIPWWIGYIAYDAYFAGRAQRLLRPQERSVLSFSRYEALIAYDHRHGAMFVVGDDEAACKRLLSRLLRSPRRLVARVGAITATPREQHRAAIHAALRHIAAGDIYQVNLARMWQASFTGDPLALWLQMRAQSRVPFGFYYDDGTRAVLSRTMERFVRWQRAERTLVSQPIKGTLARTGQSDAHDAETLRSDGKEQAEHAMIVDLMRNDLGRVAEVGSVRTPEVMRVEPYAHLSHLISTVSCRTRIGTSARDVLEATFPPGSVTGTPKLRAIEIIEALEVEPRDVYTGAVGYVDRGGGLSLAVAIRTAIAEPGRVRYFGGGGIVEASEPEREIAETELKARVFLDAAAALGEMAREQGFEPR